MNGSGCVRGFGFCGGRGGFHVVVKKDDQGEDGEHLGVRVDLVVRGEINFVSSFKDKTCKCLLSLEGFIPDEVGGFRCCSS